MRNLAIKPWMLHVGEQAGEGICLPFRHTVLAQLFDKAGRKITIPRTGAGFTIVPEKPDTSEEIRCFVAERDPGPALPAALISIDLAPLPADSLLDVAGAFRRAGSDVVEVGLPIQVVGEDHITAALERRSRP